METRSTNYQCLIPLGSLCKTIAISEVRAREWICLPVAKRREKSNKIWKNLGNTFTKHNGKVLQKVVSTLKFEQYVKKQGQFVMMSFFSCWRFPMKKKKILKEVGQN